MPGAAILPGPSPVSQCDDGTHTKRFRLTSRMRISIAANLGRLICGLKGHAFLDSHGSGGALRLVCCVEWVFPCESGFS